ncbi:MULTISPECIES: hypothetical protein [Caloramator]|uniref:Uncharacterized protein n=1 Tax=Caloramator australicus RC3 TaxID=857293 RepID=I7KUW0_9CLOT|nr:MULTISPECIES: hypothetical protein [Caloramator]MDO6353901.1 hypothetical protein [Caloramator sp. CAR-1]CCJ33738.1 hypothetical protein CAAU_1654 [Caloramator australicus RC3]
MKRFIQFTVIYSIIIFTIFLIQLTEINFYIIIKTLVGTIIVGMIFAGITVFIKTMLRNSKNK